MSVFDGLIEPNGVVRIEALSGVARDDSGGTVETYATVEYDVPVLVSQISSSRDGRFDGRLETVSGTCTGDSPNLGRQDIRLYFHPENVGVPAGVYAEVASAAGHGSAGDTLLGGRWYSAKFSVINTAAGG